MFSEVSGTGITTDLALSPRPATVGTSISFIQGPGPATVSHFVGSNSLELSTSSSPAVIFANKFTVSAYVKFTITSEHVSSMDELFPLFAYKNEGAAPSPAILLSPSGLGRMIYESSSSQQSVDFSLGTAIGVEDWVYITITYDGSQIMLTKDLSTSGTPTAVSPSPSFVLTNLYIGSTDMSISQSTFGGAIACFSIYNIVLSSSDQTLLKNACDSYQSGASWLYYND